MGEVISFGKSKQEPRWWLSGPTIKWSSQRHADLPVLEARGVIMLWDESVDNADEPTVEAGAIRVAKPYLWAGMDPLEAMDVISSDYEALAHSILGPRSYHEAFAEWFEDKFGILPISDPIFIEDIDIRPEHRNPHDPLAAQAVVEAVAAFGAPDSPIVGFGFDQVNSADIPAYRDKGLWDWVGPLGAEPWQDVLVATRPQG